MLWIKYELRPIRRGEDGDTHPLREPAFVLREGGHLERKGADRAALLAFLDATRESASP